MATRCALIKRLRITSIAAAILLLLLQGAEFAMLEDAMSAVHERTYDQAAVFWQKL
jgi:hypothetical protein